MSYHIGWQCYSGLLCPYWLCFLVLPISDRETIISATVNMDLSVYSFNSISFGSYILKLYGKSTMANRNITYL